MVSLACRPKGPGQAPGAAAALVPVPGAGEGEVGGVSHLAFLDADQVLACVLGRQIVFNLSDGASREVLSARVSTLFVSRSGGFGLGIADARPGYSGKLVQFGLDSRAPPPIPSHGGKVMVATMDAAERLLATGSDDGTIRIGPASGAEPHLFFGHKGGLFALAFSPHGRWLASGGEDMKIRLWPVPDVSKAPMHMLPHDELLRRLRTFTNLRAVADPQPPTRYKLEIGPFPGWASLPEW